MIERYLRLPVKADLADKMVFIGGPRQIGKTTFALSLLDDPRAERSPAYVNWDAVSDREMILKGQLPSTESTLILDEIHKYGDWRNFVKGFYDKNKSAVSVIVTGSAKLDHYRRGGDSLQGRYHYFRLHPFSINEVDAHYMPSTVEHLMQFGGFPEPCIKGSARFHRRWQREMTARITNDDVRDLENVQEISKLDLLLYHLPQCVGSPLSVNSLRKLLQVAHQSVDRWLTIFDNLYVTFQISPFGSSRIRAVKKEKKLYFRDWSRVADHGARFENMVACHLLKYCDFVEDTEGYGMELRYIRDVDGREIDFVVLRDGNPEFAVECKCGERPASPACRYYRERTDIPEFYQVHIGQKDYGNAQTETRVLPFHTFCREKQLP